ncbi:class I SAM-dependent methyltransferase [Tropicibacter sp. R15_0]|uniref:class I SAM-dependent methyltransferase n=1 Tax=Tropicibacter sp. R15_0 TaxID=2821101 RepID=UPI001ADC9F11|nr:methyltransferase [Tropicibacter sp. R15_0]MBO9465794.1 class I SAM-dependent methyltransferase [Tropicibacter sp. R15_0]
MSLDRLTFAMNSAELELPSGRIGLFGALMADGLGPFKPADVEVIQTFYPEYQAWEKRVTTTTHLNGAYEAVVVTLPRAKDLAQQRIAQAEEAASGGLVIVTGAKTDGIDPIAKALKGKVTLEGNVSKAHGRCLWFKATGALSDWLTLDMSANAEGDMTAPGVFSAAKSDPASRALAAALPNTIKGRVADLGAGWGWLSREILKRDKVRELHLVEADLTALTCAKVNADDPRAQYHWDDATRWQAPAPLDAVIMNPPFHTSRKGEPALGQAFITNAARLLSTSGQLWMVANRHLPYETVLQDRFREVSEIAGDTKFKILHATRPVQRTRTGR